MGIAKTTGHGVRIPEPPAMTKREAHALLVDVDRRRAAAVQDAGTVYAVAGGRSPQPTHDCAGADMLQDLPRRRRARNYGRTAGPAESQILHD